MLTDHRRADVWLPAAEPRCVPSQTCDRVWSCARFLAQIPAHGGAVADYSIQSMPVLVPTPCAQWRAVERQPASAAPRRVHPPMGAPV